MDADILLQFFCLIRIFVGWSKQGLTNVQKLVLFIDGAIVNQDMFWFFPSMVNVKQSGSETLDLGRLRKIEITHSPSFDVKFTNIEMLLSFE